MIKNKLGIPDKGVNFCLRCYEFHEHSVVVKEDDPEVVIVILECLDCGDELELCSEKNTFYEYDEGFNKNEFQTN